MQTNNLASAVAILLILVSSCNRTSKRIRELDFSSLDGVVLVGAGATPEMVAAAINNHHSDTPRVAVFMHESETPLPKRLTVAVEPFVGTSILEIALRNYSLIPESATVVNGWCVSGRLTGFTGSLADARMLEPACIAQLGELTISRAEHEAELRGMVNSWTLGWPHVVSLPTGIERRTTRLVVLAALHAPAEHRPKVIVTTTPVASSVRRQLDGVGVLIQP